MLRRTLLLCGVIVLILSGCTQASQQSIEDSLELKIKMTMLEPGRVIISAGMHNPGRQDYPGNEDYFGVIMIKDEAGNLLNEGNVYEFSKLAAGETFYPFTYEVNLVPGVYNVQFSALDKEPLKMQFEILNRDGTLILSAPADVIDPFTLYVEAKEVINISN